MTTPFKDHFSDKSADYQSYRPHYPAELFSYLASLTPEKHLAWDCATGNGQAAIALADFFSCVIATDASESQIRNTTSHARIAYKNEPAENTSIKSVSVDLVTVAQALHWLDLERFAKEVTRVLKPDGVLAAWTYGLFSSLPPLDNVIAQWYETTLGSYWPPERRLVETSYASIDMPMLPLETPTFHMTAEWDFSQLIGYLGTWSAVKRYEKVNGVSPIDSIAAQLGTLWGEPNHKRMIEWPLTLKVWEKDS